MRITSLLARGQRWPPLQGAGLRRAAPVRPRNDAACRSYFVLDNIPLIALYPSRLVREGRSHEASLSGARCGACGRGRTYPSHSGGLGSPSGPTTGLCHSVAGRVRMTAGESRSDGRAPASFQYPEARSLGQKPSRWHAVRRCAAQVCRRSGRQEQRQKPPLAPGGVPPPLMSSRGDLLTPRTRKRRENAHSRVTTRGQMPQAPALLFRSLCPAAIKAT